MTLSLHLILVVSTLVGVQIIIGKKASFPYGILMGLSPLTIGIIVLFSDLGTIPLLQFLLSSSQKIRWVETWRQKLIQRQGRWEQQRWFQSVKRMQNWGVTAVVAVPLLGGINTGAIMSHLLNLKKFEAFVFMGLGAAVGSAIFVLGAYGILALTS